MPYKSEYKSPYQFYTDDFQPPTPSAGNDPLWGRTRAHIRTFLDWCQTNGVKGYLAEFGWPNDESPIEWNLLANKFYEELDFFNASGTYSATGEHLSPTYKLLPYKDNSLPSGIDTPLTQAPTIEFHPGTGNPFASGYYRGVMLSGAEIGIGATFSNVNLGIPGVDYFHVARDTFDYLYGRGLKLFRYPIRWERIQPTLNGPLDSAELVRMRDAFWGASRELRPATYSPGYGTSSSGCTNRLVSTVAGGSRHEMGGTANGGGAVGTLPIVPSGTYSFWNTLSGSFKSARWKLRPEVDPTPSGYFFGNQGAIVNSDVWYAGIQAKGNIPIPAFTGRLAIFSMWGGVDSVSNPDVSGAYAAPFIEGGDGGHTVRVPYFWDPAKTYELRIQADTARGARWWACYIIDETTGTEIWVGSIQAPVGSGDLSGVTTQFTELFSISGTPANCQALTYVDTFFGQPAFGQVGGKIALDIHNLGGYRLGSGEAISGPSSVMGGGFQNAGAFAPSGVGHDWYAVAGADVAGFHVTEDGVNWRKSNKGIVPWFGNHRVAAVEGSRTVANRLWAFVATSATGIGSPGGRLIRGTYDPITKVITWEAWVDVTDGAAAGGSIQPRQVGRLIALDEANDVLFLGTRNGVYKIDITAKVATQRALSGSHITGLLVDPTSTNIAWAVADAGGTNAGFYRINNIRTGTVTTTVNNTLTDAQDLSLVDAGGTRYIFVAAFTQGVRRWLVGTDASLNWTDITGTFNLGGAGNGACGVATLDSTASLATTRVVISNAGEVSLTNAGAISNDGGATWTNEVGNWTTSDVPAGESTNWWLLVTNPAFRISNGSYDCTNPRIDPNNNDRIYFWGRSGIWRSINGGLNWHPTVRGLCATVAWGVFFDPTNDNRCIVTDGDWTVIRSADRFTTMPARIQPNADTGSGAMFRRDNGKLVVATTDGGTTGEVYTTTDPWTGTPTWTAQGFNAVSGGANCLGAAIGQDGGNEILLTLRQGVGIQRKSGAGAPSTVSTLATHATGNMIPRFCWPNSHTDANVYCATNVGLLRSTDRGINWTNIHAKTNTSEYTGKIIYDPVNPTTLYYTVDNGVAGDTGLWKVTNANSGSPTFTKIGPVVTSPGPCTMHPTSKQIYMATTADEVGGPKLYRSNTADPGISSVFGDVSDQRWPATVTYPFDMDCASDGTIIASDKQGGYFKYSPGPADAKIGSPVVTQAHFTNLWDRLAEALQFNPNIDAYALMGQPQDIPSAFIVKATVSGFSSIGDWHINSGGGTLTLDSTVGKLGLGSLKLVKTWAAGGTDTSKLDESPTALQDRTANGLSFAYYVLLPEGSPTGFQARIEIWSDGAFRAGPLVTLIPGEWTEVKGTFAAEFVDSMKEFLFHVQHTSSPGVSVTMWFDDLKQGDDNAGPKMWELHSQAAVSAIRTSEGSGVHKTISVPGALKSAAQTWDSTHPTSWIIDPNSNFVYEAVHWWDDDHSGAYAQTYAQEVADAIAEGFTSPGSEGPPPPSVIPTPVEVPEFSGKRRWRKIGFRYDLLTYDQKYKKTIDTVQPGATVEWDSENTIMRTLKLVMKDDQDVNWLSDKIQVWFMAIDDDNGDYYEYPLGLFLFLAPPRTVHTYGAYREVQAFEKTWDVERTFFTKTGSMITIPGGNSLPSGTYITDAIEKMILTSDIHIPGVNQIQLGPDDTKTTIARTWELGNNRLASINELLDVIGYYPLFTDGFGTFRSDGIPVFEKAPPDNIFETSDSSWVQYPIQDSVLTTRVWNVVFLQGESPNNETTYSTILSNVRADSPMSIQNVGRELWAPPETVQDVFKQSQLDVIARVRLQEGTNLFHVVEFDTPIMPRPEPFSICRVDLKVPGQDEPISGNFVERKWSIDCKPGGRMHHTLHRIIPSVDIQEAI